MPLFCIIRDLQLTGESQLFSKYPVNYTEFLFCQFISWTNDPVYMLWIETFESHVKTERKTLSVPSSTTCDLESCIAFMDGLLTLAMGDMTDLLEELLFI